MFQYRQFSFILLLAFSSILFFTDCKTDAKTDTTSSTTPINNTVTVGLKTEPDAIHPILARQNSSRTIYRHIFNSLMEYSPVSGELEPFLATAPPTKTPITEGKYKGGISYTFEIRPEAKWDNGQPILASDFEFTLKAILNPQVKTAWKGAISPIAALELDETNPRKLTVFSAACKIQEDETIATIQIYPAYAYDPAGLMEDIALADLIDAKKAESLKTNENVIAFAKQFSAPEYSREPSKVSGSGAYQLDTLKTKEVVILKRKKDWWADGLAEKESIFTANPTELIYKIIPDPTTGISMLKDGELDLLGEIPAEAFHDLEQSEIGQKNLNFKTPNVPSLYYMPMNAKRPALSDKRVRQAVSHLIDMQQYIEDNTYGYATQTANPFPTYRPYHNTDIPLPNLDLEKAKDLLDAAGWKDSDGDGIRDKIVNGKKTDLSIDIKNSPKSTHGPKIAQILKANGQKIGFQINVVARDFRTIMGQDVPKGDYDMIGAGVRFGEPKYDNPYLYYHTDNFASKGKGGRNYGHFGNAKSDALIESIVNNCDDDTARDRDFKELQEMIHEERPLFYLFFSKEQIAVNKRFDNVVTSHFRPGFFENYFVAKK